MEKIQKEDFPEPPRCNSTGHVWPVSQLPGIVDVTAIDWRPYLSVSSRHGPSNNDEEGLSKDLVRCSDGEFGVGPSPSEVQ